LSAPTTNLLKYRADVDGLRAFAVVAVLLFHLGLPGIGGGYVGVDVFFVISGFLITGLVTDELEGGRFSFARFYLRRLRRLGPALFVVTATTSVAAAWLLLPEDTMAFAASLLAQFASLQNIVFLVQGEYFRGAETKLLLHTWSLAVEEQFYLLWPLALLVLTRFAKERRVVVVVALIVLSFALNLVLMRVSAKASFFLLPSRAWELLVGGGLALLDRRGALAALGSTTRSALALVGLACMLAACALFDGNTPFPGFAASLPVVGSALFIAAGSGGGAHALSRPFTHPLVVHVGLISYPLYLWHWPLIAGTHHLGLDPSTTSVAAVVLVASFALAEGTYRFVESPIRHGRVLSGTRALLAVAALFVVVLGALALAARATEGAAFRFPSSARPFLTAPFASKSDRCGFVFRVLHPNREVCPLVERASAPRRVLVWGNSHADMWTNLLVDEAARAGASLALNARNCRPTQDGSVCSARLRDRVLDELQALGVTDVVLASSWEPKKNQSEDALRADIVAVVHALRAAKVRVWLVVDSPRGAALDPVVAFRARPEAPVAGSVPRSDHDAARAFERALFEELARADGEVRVVDPTPHLCDDTACFGGRDGAVWYRDEGHLSNAGARAAAAAFAPIFSSSTTAEPPSPPSPATP